MFTSTRRGIVYPNTNRADSADVPRDIAAVVAALEVDVVYGQGTLAARPPSSAGTPGMAGRLYYATDNSTVYYDFGTGWVAMNVVSGPTGSAGGDLTGSYPNPTIAAGAVTGAKIADGGVDGATKLVAASVNASRLAAALFPSQGAGAATEALRAIGSGAGNVVAGNDSRLNNVGTVADRSVTGIKLALSINDTGVAFNVGAITDTALRVHRTPYGNARHICVGAVSMPSDVGSGATGSVSFDRAFSAAPFIGATPNKFIAWAMIALSGSGMSIQGSGASGAWALYYIAEGAS